MSTKRFMDFVVGVVSLQAVSLFFHVIWFMCWR